MINWTETKTQYGYDTIPTIKRPKVICACDKCGKQRSIIIRVRSRIVDGQMPWLCQSCVKLAESLQISVRMKKQWQNEEYRKSTSKSLKKLWENKDYRERHNAAVIESMKSVDMSSILADRYKDPAARDKLKQISLKLYENPEFKAKHKQSLNTPELHQKFSQGAIEAWKDPEYRNIVLEAHKQLAKDPAYVAKMSKAMLALWQDPVHQAKMVEAWDDPELRQRISEDSKKKWQNQAYREQIAAAIKRYYSNPINRARISETSKRLWQDPIYKERMAEIWSNPEIREKIANKAKELWKDPAHREKMATIWESPKFRERLLEIWTDPVHLEQAAEISRKLWQDPVYRQHAIQARKLVWQNPAYREKMAAIWADPAYLERAAEISRKLWQDPAYRQCVIQAHKDPVYLAKMAVIWADPIFKAKMAEILRNQPKVSSQQEILYSILTDFGIKYYREYNDRIDDKECVIGPWPVDCVIPRDGKPWLIIECQGDYWHSRKEKIARDKAKSTYLMSLSDQYELKYFWEHEFLCKDKIVETLKYWLGIVNIDTVDYDLKNLDIRLAPAKDYKLLLGKYHYLPNAGRGGIVYGAYLHNELVAVCVFSPMVRQNIDTLDYDPKESRELSRLCVNPKYRKDNLLSYFVSHCLKLLDAKYKLVISYCDTTFNHNGAVYKACNFELVGTVPPDYWYVDSVGSGWWMHKRTLYGHAVRMGVTEAEFAEQHGYNKVWGLEKLKFIYRR